MELKQVCEEILSEAKKKNVHTLREFNQIKHKILRRLKYKEIPKNATIDDLSKNLVEIARHVKHNTSYKNERKIQCRRHVKQIIRGINDENFC